MTSPLALPLIPGGNAYVAGYTKIHHFRRPLPYQPTNAGSTDAFVHRVRLIAGATLVYSTYLGGSGDGGAGFVIGEPQAGGGIANLIPRKNAYGSTKLANFSTNFPTQSPYQSTKGGGYDAFVTKLDPSGIVGPVISTDEQRAALTNLYASTNGAS